MNDPLHEEQLSSEAVFEGRLLNVFRDEVRLPDGKRQFRYPLGRAFLELPAGKIDAGEDILACARRELQEETGYEGSHWRHLGVMHPCIGYSDERIEIFIATGLTHVGHSLDDGEFLEVIRMSLAEARAAVFDGRITDAKTITALFWAERELAGT